MWRFVHITDPHLASKRNGVWNNGFLCSMMPEVMQCLRRDLASLSPDFMLVTGDIVSHHTRQAAFTARDMLESLGFPYYPMGGNHDFYSMPSRAWFLEAYEHRLPASNSVYSFVHKNLRFCVLDPWWVWRDDALMPTAEPDIAKQQETSLRDTRWALPPEQFVWLESVLRAFPKLPTCLAFHYPALPAPQRLRHADYQNAGSLENGALLMDVVSKYPHVKALFCGHIHTNSIVTQNGVVQITTSALPEYPVEYREIKVFGDRMEISTHGLSDPSFAEKSRIAGHEYTAGEAQDRSIVIPLR
jgi:3',5'-cyclic AMP phosphodiesterase CpdA